MALLSAHSSPSLEQGPHAVWEVPCNTCWVGSLTAVFLGGSMTTHDWDVNFFLIWLR